MSVATALTYTDLLTAQLIGIIPAGTKEENGPLTCLKETEELSALVSSGAEQQRGIPADLRAASTERSRAETCRRGGCWLNGRRSQHVGF